MAHTSPDMSLLGMLDDIRQAQAQLAASVESFEEKWEQAARDTRFLERPCGRVKSDIHDSKTKCRMILLNEADTTTLMIMALAHGGSYSIYHALAVASKQLDVNHRSVSSVPAAHMSNHDTRPDFTNTEPAVTIGPFSQWNDVKKIVAMDPWGHMAPWLFKNLIKNEDKLEESVKSGRLFGTCQAWRNGSNRTVCFPNIRLPAYLNRHTVVYNARKRGEDKASDYFRRTENIAGVKDMRFQALMPDILHWLGIKKIDRMLSMSKIPIHERVELPEDRIPEDSRVEIDAKITAGLRNKRLSKGKKGLKKKTQDPFSRKDWYSIKAPSPFNIRDVGKTLVNRTTDEDHSFRKIRLRVDEIQGKNCLTNFHGLDFTTDKLRSLVRKWQTLIEANITVKTTDDYLLRLFAIAFTKRRPNQVKKTTYAASSQIRAIRRKMMEIMQREASSCTLTQLTAKLIPEVIGREIEKATQGIYPLQNVHIRKVKLLKQPKFDLGSLMALHGESGTDEKGQRVDREFQERVLEEV
ncbi:unnamed protein product [Parascedosporium putredinis]|uniref:Small ribosomal subunit protein eS1 n=1 Tax=Parascedosporium putredinis TaxID=1442378 RepID=A0A9P1GTC2_9PEZI|nr:unnamed protein product [Parascedosporium putredinis]CAI7987259.1 unnamed protein product [Parascedosporium putredinis]